jgi:RecQ-mediated genome instability protein 1
MATSTDLSSSIAASLTASHLSPTPKFLQTLPKSSAPLRAQQKTAHFHLLRAHLPDAVVAMPDNTFPTAQPDANKLEARLRGPIPVQVLDIEDIGRSRWTQVEGIEAIERGEGKVGRKIVRLDEAEGEQDARKDPVTAAMKPVGPHRLVLIDAAGKKLFAVELKPVRGIGAEMMIGCKLILRDALITRGVLMLEPTCCEVLGGKVEELHKTWEEGRKERLMAAIQENADI